MCAQRRQLNASMECCRLGFRNNLTDPASLRRSRVTQMEPAHLSLIQPQIQPIPSQLPDLDLVLLPRLHLPLLPA